MIIQRKSTFANLVQRVPCVADQMRSNPMEANQTTHLQYDACKI
jgi:hypothetical protein